jgi:LL-diaminopimelate aminotransferase
MKKNLDNEKYHTYPPQDGLPEFKKAICDWYKKRFNADIKLENVLITIGIKEVIFNTFHAMIDAGDAVLLPDPGYPTYFEAAYFTGSKVLTYNSNYDEDKLFIEIKNKLRLYKPKILILNFPCNPTGNNVSLDFYNRMRAVCEEVDTMVFSDLAYSEIYYDDNYVYSYFHDGTSLFNGLEFFAFSKTYNMAGWRVGAIVGDKDIIDAVKLYKSKIDSNVFCPIQKASIAALEETPESFYIAQRKMYQERRDILSQGFENAGINFTMPKGAMYMWVDIPKNIKDSWEFTRVLYSEFGILTVPGTAYGVNGANKVRVGLVQDSEVLREASDRLTNGGFRFE